MSIDIIKALQNTTGADTYGISKSALTMSYIKIDLDNDCKTNVVNELSMHNPIVEISSKDEFIEIDLKFKEATDNDLRCLWNLLESYKKNNEKVDILDGTISNVQLVIVPIILKGTAFFVIKNPLFWAVQPEMPSSNKNNVLRILFPAKEIKMVETDQIDVAKIDKDLEQEYNSLSYMYEQEERKKEEDEEYEATRNAKIEELRKNKQL